MIKQILLLIPVLLILTSCGEEKQELQKDPNYNYVEIEECTIPIPKRFEMTNHGNNEPYIHNYVYKEEKNILAKQYIVSTKKRYENDYVNTKEFIAQGKDRTIISESTRVNFKILESKIYDDTIYQLYGKKSVIILMPSNKEEVDYLLDYCEKTWKLNKGDN